MAWQIPYGANRIKNPGAEAGDTSEWTAVSNVTSVLGGYSGSRSFRFEPTASMKQTVSIPGNPVDLDFSFLFLPGRDIQSGSAVKAQVRLQLRYGDGAKANYLIPGKSFIEGYWV